MRAWTGAFAGTVGEVVSVPQAAVIITPATTAAVTAHRVELAVLVP